MKTTEDLKQEIAMILYEMKQQASYDTKDSKRAIKSLKTRLEYVKVCLRYIESNPTLEFLEKEKSRLSSRVSGLMKTYVPLDVNRVIKSEVAKHRRNYEKEMGIPKLKKQLATLNYLLK